MFKLGEKIRIKALPNTPYGCPFNYRWIGKVGKIIEIEDGGYFRIEVEGFYFTQYLFSDHIEKLNRQLTFVY